MSWEALLILLLTVGVVWLFIKETFPPDQTAFSAYALLLLIATVSGSALLPSVNDLATVFSNPAPMTVAAMFVISRALEKSGAIDALGVMLNGLTRLGYRTFLFCLILLVGVISAFVNNTPVVVVFVPVVLALARPLGVSASKLLIPVSFAAVCGGLCTLLGTSTNLVVSGLLTKYDMPPMGMFELAPLGVPLLVLAAIYMVVVAPKLLPDRGSLTSILSEDERREFLTEAFIRNDSPMAGKTLLESGLLKQRGLRILELIRDGVSVSGPLKEATLTPGDRLVVACRPSGIASVRSTPGIDLVAEAELGIETIAAYEGAIVEGVIGPKSSLVGKTALAINFRQRFRVILLAIHRNGVNLREKAESTPLQFGDILLMMGADKARDELRRSEDILLLDRPATPALDYRKKIPLVVAVIAAVVGFSAFDTLPIHIASLIGCAVLFATGSLTPKEGYDSIDWGVLLIIYSMLGFGMAMETSGAASIIVNAIVHGASVIAPAAVQPLLLLAVIYLVSMVLTEFLSNNAAAVLMVPLAMGVAVHAGLDPRPYMIAVCIAATAAFATPIGYQTNTYVYGIGNYKFADFLKIGLPLNLLYFAGCMVLIPMIWPLKVIIK
ncbi:MAG: SLC13 family permease [Verrucomicrobiota bacterium]|nr:SLC13 family permease [Verrucomicrobiota bacterium]